MEQDKFLNCVLRLETVLQPKALLETLQQIEAREGRTREVHWGPRTLDLDILFYDHLVMNAPELTIPHVDLQNRLFVLEPLREIAPWYRHPVLGQSVEQMYGQLCAGKEQRPEA